MTNNERNSRFKHNDKDLTIVCININNNSVTGGTIATIPEPSACEECFIANLNETQLSDISSVLSDSDFINLEGLCEISFQFNNSKSR